MKVLIKQQYVHTGFVFGAANNFLQSLGNVSFPINFLAIPGYALPSYWNSGIIDPVASYVIFSTELFITAFVVARFIGLTPIAATVAAWLLPLITHPYFRKSAIYGIMSLVPHCSTLMLATVAIIILFIEIGKHREKISVALFVALCACVIYILVSQPTGLILIMPVLFVFICIGIKFSTSSVENKFKLLAVMAGGIFLITGPAQYLLGLVKYSAATFFSQDLINDRMDLMYVSLFFHGGFSTCLICLAFIGALIIIFIGRANAKLFGAATLACSGLIISLGYILTRIDYWRGPSPLYFEFVLWPFYVVFASVAVLFSLGVVSNFLGNRWFIRGALIGIANSANGLLFVAILPWAILLWVHTTTSAEELQTNYPPPSSPIIEILKRNIAIHPGGEFRGRIATFTGMKDVDKPTSWIDLHTYDGQIIKKIGNDHRMVGLWFDDIPTLMEYNSLLTPAFYAFTKTFFALPYDRQMRSVMVLRRPNAKLLAAIGVRFVVTDSKISEGVNIAVVSLGNIGNLYLYEISRPNLGQYSPTIAVVSTKAKEMLSIMDGQDFDPMHKIVVQTTLPSDLVEANQSKIFAEKGYLRIVATSEGASVILLPIEFSHCLTLHDESGMDTPRLFRANLLQTAIMFKKDLNVKLVYHTGPFRMPHCRLDDSNEYSSLK
jgi:hypothetical protein